MGQTIQESEEEEQLKKGKEKKNESSGP